MKWSAIAGDGGNTLTAGIDEIGCRSGRLNVSKSAGTMKWSAIAGCGGNTLTVGIDEIGCRSGRLNVSRKGGNNEMERNRGLCGFSRLALLGWRLEVS